MAVSSRGTAVVAASSHENDPIRQMELDETSGHASTVGR